jgi:hypothetical protein
MPVFQVRCRRRLRWGWWLYRRTPRFDKDALRIRIVETRDGLSLVLRAIMGRCLLNQPQEDFTNFPLVK